MDHRKKLNGKLLTIVGIKSGEIGYNPAVIANAVGDKKTNGQTIIAVRIENVNSYWLNPKTYNPHLMFFNRFKDNLILIDNAPVFYQYEDPFATWITVDNKMPQLLFGAVRVDFSLKIPMVNTYFFLAPSIWELNESKPVAVIKGMKDIRVTQIANGKLAVFTRHTEGLAFPGRIGFTLINKIEELEQKVVSAPLLKFEVDNKTKMGTNEAYLQNGLIHVFCHFATTDLTGALHYLGYEFNLNPDDPFTDTVFCRQIACRNDFPDNLGLSKGKVYQDVVFPGGTGSSQSSELYVGVEDACIGVIDLPTPTKPV